MDINFIENIDTGVNNWNAIQNWVQSSIENEGKKAGILSFVFMTDEELLTYNRKYLNHDYYTDVITFDDSDLLTINGDILISLEMIKNNHKELKISYKSEFLRVIIHGIMHLCGYKDKEDLDIIEMRKKEEFYLNRVDFEL